MGSIIHKQKNCEASGKVINLNVCQGVGDIFWVYQKFAPYYDTINFKICQIGNETKIGTRAIPFLKTLPKTGSVDLHSVSGGGYEHMVRTRYVIEEVMKAAEQRPGNSFDYACNKPLEEGIRIEDIDPLFPIEETVSMKIEDMDLPYSKYICLYVSGGTTSPLAWPVQAWVRFVGEFCDKLGMRLPIIMIGASYDEQITNSIKRILTDFKYDVWAFIDREPANVNYILSKASCFIGYQSGLNILADNLDTPQIMLYYDSLRNMQYSWCKRKNKDARIFNAGVFSEPTETITNRLKRLYEEVRKKS